MHIHEGNCNILMEFWLSFTFEHACIDQILIKLNADMQAG